MQGARLVVVPVTAQSIVASGISTILNAMVLGKCVVATSGPGVSEVFSDELLQVPAENVAALAETISRAWDDDALRTSVATAGLRYAMRCGTEQDMFQRIIDCLESEGHLIAE